MAITPDTRIAHVLQRMRAIVESRAYAPHEQRLRAMAQLERLLETVVIYLPAEQQQTVQAVLALYGSLWPSAETGTQRAVKECRIHTRNSVIFGTVTLDQDDETVGTIELNEESVRVFLVKQSNGREGATTQSEALYLSARRKGTSGR